VVAAAAEVLSHRRTKYIDSINNKERTFSTPSLRIYANSHKYHRMDLELMTTPRRGVRLLVV
jgi:hypothetical protein